MWEEASVCPTCGDHITPGAGRTPLANVPPWVAALGAIGVVLTCVALALA